ncbi:MAG TPA: sulfotransferase [Patescibacteria group bacterium]|nr:sulfotransferase [Patescibacteria group bacterium]
MPPAISINPLVEILEIAWFPQDPGLLIGANIDAPLAGTYTSRYAFEIGGWVLGRHSKAVSVELVHENRALRKVPLQQARVDVEEHFPGSTEARTCGFWTAVSVSGMRTEFEVLVQAVLEDGTRVPLASIRGRHKQIGVTRKTGIQPLIVTTWGRSGSTLLMRLLLEHPQIVGFREYPYEARIASYWLHLLKVLIEPSNHSESTHPDDFTEDLQWIGHMPFYTEPLTLNPALSTWLGKEYVEQAASFCHKSIQGFYRELAKAQKQRNVRYFAEKNHPTHTSWLFWELYPEARELFLVRDFRDMVCSIFAFNQKRGFASFGQKRASTDEEFLELQRVGAECLLDSWRRRRAFARLVRYEDLVLHPLETLAQIFTYLGLEHNDSLTERALREATAESPILHKHRTTPTIKDSIGRWQTDLSPDLQTRCHEAFGPMLKEFGYQV